MKARCVHGIAWFRDCLTCDREHGSMELAVEEAHALAIQSFAESLTYRMLTVPWRPSLSCRVLE